MALAYAYRTALTGDAQEAVWAGRCVYETVDHYASASLSGAFSGFPEESRLLGHPAVQAEIGRQQRDLVELGAIRDVPQLHAALRALRERSEREAGSVFIE